MAKNDDIIKPISEEDKRKMKNNRSMMWVSFFAGTMFLIAAVISFWAKKNFIGSLDIIASIAQYILAFINWNEYSKLKGEVKKVLMNQEEMMKQRNKEKELQKEFNFFEKSRK